MVGYNNRSLIEGRGKNLKLIISQINCAVPGEKSKDLLEIKLV
jgi:hypothetical protein